MLKGCANRIKKNKHLRCDPNIFFLSWRVSTTMDNLFCIEALEEAIIRFGKPDIFNADQGSQFTSEAFTGILKANKIRISMDGKGRWRNNIFIELLWWSVKYEEVYLKAYGSKDVAKQEIRSKTK